MPTPAPISQDDDLQVICPPVNPVQSEVNAIVAMAVAGADPSPSSRCSQPRSEIPRRRPSQCSERRRGRTEQNHRGITAAALSAMNAASGPNGQGNSPANAVTAVLTRPPTPTARRRPPVQVDACNKLTSAAASAPPTAGASDAGGGRMQCATAAAQVHLARRR